MYMEGNTLKEEHVDCHKAFGKKYKFVKNMTVSFMETADTDLENAYKYFNDDFTGLEAGDEIVIIDAKISEYKYYVELADGRRGVMITQLAG